MKIDKTILILFVAFMITSMVMILFQPVEKAVSFSVIDDGMYYLKTAMNFFKYGKVTCDGMTVTNGFQPLWFVILLPIFLFVKDPMLGLKFVFWFIFLLTTVSFWQFVKLSKQLKIGYTGIIVAIFIIFLNLRVIVLIYSLMEVPIVILSYILFLNYIIKVGEKRYTDSKTAFLTGFLMGLAFLARTDTMLLAFSYSIFLTIMMLQKKISFVQYIKTGVSAAGGMLTLALPYLLLNFVTFGRLLPVSGYVKIKYWVFHDPKWLYEPIRYFLIDYLIPRLCYVFGIPEKFGILILIIIILVSIGILVFIFTGNRYKRLKSITLSMKEFILFTIIHFSFTYFFMPYETFIAAWYYISEIIVIALILGALIPENGKLKWAVATIIIFTVAAQLSVYPRFVKNKKVTWAKLEVAKYIKENLPKDALITMGDGGITSYFAERNFIILRGFIGDFELLDMINNKQFKEIGDKYNVQYAVVAIPIHLIDQFPGKILYVSKIETQFLEFSRGMKKFVVVESTPDVIMDFCKKNGFSF